jgi:hypothetical protein
MVNIMRRKAVVALLCGILVLSIGGAGEVNEVGFQIGETQEIGKKEPIFSSIASVCEDSDSNFYVLDRMEHKVYKFSPEGDLILSFGQKGQGPGDYQNPHLLAFSPRGHLIVADEMYNLTFLNGEGGFIQRVHLDGRLEVGYIGEDRFYGWSWGEDNRSQVMVDKKNNVVKNFFQVLKSAFSASVPDETGRRVMFNYSRSEFAPSLQFAHAVRYSAVGIGERYDLSILDENGEVRSRLRRDIQPDNFSKKEKIFFEEDIGAQGKERGWPGSIVRSLVKKIPEKKIFFDHVLMTDELVFVFRIRSDITEERGPIPVDVFSINGKFLGDAYLPQRPLHISRGHMYFVRSDEQGNLLLEKTAYKVIRN